GAAGAGAGRARHDDQLAPLLERGEVESGLFRASEADQRNRVVLAQMLQQVIGAAAPAAGWRIGHIRRQHQNVWFGHRVASSIAWRDQCSSMPEGTSSARIPGEIPGIIMTTSFFYCDILKFPRNALQAGLEER